MATVIMVFHWSPLLHLDDPFDGDDGGVQQGADSLLVVDVVGVAYAHEDDVGWQPGQEADRHTAGFQI